MGYEIKFKKSKLIPIFQEGEEIDWNGKKATIKAAFHHGKGGPGNNRLVIEYSIKASEPTPLITEEKLLEQNPWAGSRKLK